jgi:hypothetical protein
MGTTLRVGFAMGGRGVGGDNPRVETTFAGAGSRTRAANRFPPALVHPLLAIPSCLPRCRGLAGSLSRPTGAIRKEEPSCA